MHSTYRSLFLSIFTGIANLSNLIISVKLVRHALLEAVVITQLFQSYFSLIPFFLDYL